MKRTRALAVFLSCVMFVSACGEVAPESLAFAMTDNDQTVVRIATPRIDGFESVIANWEREHPTVEVEVVVRDLDDHHESLLNGSSAGRGFDILAFDASYGPDVRNQDNLFIDLSQLDNTPESDQFLDVRWDEGIAQNGAVIGLPLDVESTALLVRRDLVDANVLRKLRSASTWCDVLAAGDAFSDATNTAFLADSDEFLSAILAQTRTSFIDENGSVDPNEIDELERAFDLAMITIGEDPLHTEPCPLTDDIQRISRDLPLDSDQWRTELQGGGFAAAVAPWSFRRRIASAAPATAGLWETISLPVDSAAPTAGSSSDGGLHFGIAIDTEQPTLAYDLLLTLTDPAIQEVAFARGLGPLPAAASLHRGDGVVSAADDFFANDSTAQIYSEAATNRPEAMATPERRIMVDAMLSALNRVESGGQTPREAWTSMLDQVAKALT